MVNLAGEIRTEKFGEEDARSPPSWTRHYSDVTYPQVARAMPKIWKRLDLRLFGLHDLRCYLRFVGPSFLSTVIPRLTIVLVNRITKRISISSRLTKAIVNRGITVHGETPRYLREIYISIYIIYKSSRLYFSSTSRSSKSCPF